MGKRKIIGLILCGISILGLVAGGGNISESLPPAIIFFIIGLFLIIKKPKTKEEKQQSKENAKKVMETKLNKFNAKHQTGLPLATGSDCLIRYEEDKFNFNGAGNDFNLSFNKITDICIKTETEIHKQYVSSIGGAVAGGVVFGPLGAIVGGRAKQKKSKTINKYLIFTYLKDGLIDYISFDVTNNFFKAQKVVDMFNRNNKIVQGNVVDL